MNRKGWRFEPDGARPACHRIVARSASGIGVSRYRLIALVVANASSTPMRSSIRRER